jgi:AcrR family transcriptional regulator
MGRELHLVTAGAAGLGTPASRGRPPAERLNAGGSLRVGGPDTWARKGSLRLRVVDAALVCLARQGVRKTTVDDVARQAGVSRATLYRNFPGGRDAVLAAVVETEVARLFSRLGAVMGAAEDVEEMLVAGLSEAAEALTGHDALRYLFTHEPEVVLPSLAFARMDRLLAVAAGMAGPSFERWLEPDHAARAAEWLTRIVVSYVSCPTEGADLTRPEDVRRLVRCFVLPGVLVSGSTGEPTSTSTSRRSTSTRSSRVAERGEGQEP